MDQPDCIDAFDRSPTNRPDRAAAGPADADADVLLLVDRGDTQRALHRLMDRHGAAVYRFCCEGLRDPRLADDVHQQVFLEAFRDLATFGRRSTVRCWLFGIARHRLLDAAKRRRRARARISESDLGAIPDAGPSPCDALEHAQLHAALVACVREFDNELQTALLLRYQQGFTFEEMAAICGEKPGTLQARVARALPVLRTCLEVRLRHPQSR